MIARFPALKNVASTLIDACIAAAELRTPAVIWDTLEDEGVLHLAAHLICLDPSGVNARLVDKSGRSVYLAERERLEMIVSSGYRVVGDTSEIVI